jgi:hypothetical protein
MKKTESDKINSTLINIGALVLVLVLSSCTAADFRKSVGIAKDSPDEFMVQPRPKLKIPDAEMALPVPQKKVDTHLRASETGREALYGEAPKDNRPNSAAENALIAKAGATAIDPKIRREVEKEYKGKSGVFGTERGGVLETILDPFGYNKPVDPVVDPKAENKRIREAIRKGEKIDASKVKSKDPLKDKIKEEGIF